MWTAETGKIVQRREQEEFYKGRSVTMLVGSDAGGGYDTYSRVLGRHMGKHISGNPNIIPKKMPGAGPINASNYLYNVHPVTVPFSQPFPIHCPFNH